MNEELFVMIDHNLLTVELYIASIVTFKVQGNALKNLKNNM